MLCPKSPGLQTVRSVHVRNDMVRSKAPKLGKTDLLRLLQALPGPASPWAPSAATFKSSFKRSEIFSKSPRRLHSDLTVTYRVLVCSCAIVVNYGAQKGFAKKCIFAL